MPARTAALLRARTLSRAAGVGIAAAAAVLLLAVPALAHITVTPDSAPAGSATVLTFHVPNEEAHADTTGVDMQIPTSHPIAQLLVQPVPGWKISVRTVTLAKPIVTDDGQFTQAVSEVIWSGGQIPPGQFQDFTVSADPLPQGLSQMVFKAIQTYSNGDVVRWIDLAQPGQPEPDHPAPVLTLTTASSHAKTIAATSGGSASGGSGSDGLARSLGIAGLLALGVAGRRRRSPAEAPAAGLPVPDPGPAGKPAAARTQAARADAKTPAAKTPAAKTAPRSQPRRRR